MDLTLALAPERFAREAFFFFLCLFTLSSYAKQLFALDGVLLLLKLNSFWVNCHLSGVPHTEETGGVLVLLVWKAKEEFFRFELMLLPVASESGAIIESEFVSSGSKTRVCWREESCILFAGLVASGVSPSCPFRKRLLIVHRWCGVLVSGLSGTWESANS